jgi:hypothetical protein
MGGNIFDFTGPIKKEDIRPTLLKFFAELKEIFPSAGPYFSQMKTLGSVGKKDMSGDIDLALSGQAFQNIEDWDLDPQHVQNLFDGFKKRAKSSTDDQLMKRAVIVAIAQKIEESGKQIAVDVKGSGSGALFLAFPQYDTTGNQLDNAVQIDINVGDVDWLEFAYYSDKYEGNVKGLHRTQLMLSLFSNAGYTFSHNYGVKDKETQEIVATNPAQAIDILNSAYGFKLTSDILQNYFKLQEFLRSNLDQNTLSSVYDTFIKILDSTRADIPEDLQPYWIENQQRLGLKGKFLPDDSKLKKYAIQ